MIAQKFHEFIPKSWLYLRKGYPWAVFKKDLVAGVTVGIVALPLAMAFAIASGVSPERGLFTAIIAGFLISALGGSRIQIGGPTGAFVVIVYDIVQRTGYNGLCLSTLVAALLLLLLGIFRIGSWIKYVPHPLVVGFTTGIAVIIFSTQIKDFFGLKMGTPPADFIEKWTSYIYAFPTLDLTTFFIAGATLGLILIIRRYTPSIPWGISAIVVITLVCQVFHLPLATIESKFGDIPRSLPTPSLPSFSMPFEMWKGILTDGFTIAFLGAIESLLSAVIGDGMIGGRHRSNCELVAQGMANFGSIIFGGIPATGAIARTATNVKTGAQTPMAGMIHAVVLFGVLVFLAPFVSKIPLAALAAVLMMVAWNMSEMPHFINLLKTPYGDRLVLVTAFLLTVFVDITVAISVGMVLATFVFMKRMSGVSRVVPLGTMFQEEGSDFPEQKDPDDISKKQIPSGVEVFEIQGPFFFGTASLLKDLMGFAMKSTRVFILRMRHVPMVDASGMYALKEFLAECQKERIAVILSGIQSDGQAMKDLKRLGLVKLVGKDRICSTIDLALKTAEEIAS